MYTSALNDMSASEVSGGTALFDKRWFSDGWKDPAGPFVINRLTFLLLVIDLLSSSSKSPRFIICSMSSISLKQGRLMPKQNIQDELSN